MHPVCTHPVHYQPSTSMYPPSGMAIIRDIVLYSSHTVRYSLTLCTHTCTAQTHHLCTCHLHPTQYYPVLAHYDGYNKGYSPGANPVVSSTAHTGCTACPTSSSQCVHSSTLLAQYALVQCSIGLPVCTYSTTSTQYPLYCHY